MWNGKQLVNKGIVVTASSSRVSDAPVYAAVSNQSKSTIASWSRNVPSRLSAGSSLLLAFLLAVHAFGQSPDLTSKSFEDLMNIEVMGANFVQGYLVSKPVGAADPWRIYTEQTSRHLAPVAQRVRALQSSARRILYQMK
jgi:hypothetical protein